MGKGPYAFVMQIDGNAMIYGRGGSVIWKTDTWHKGHHFVLQDDRNIVLYNNNRGVGWKSESGI